jgi:hypothetical protein
LDQITKIIIGRLEEEGIHLVKIPLCFETLVNIIFLNPVLNCQELNRSMQSLGWHNFKIDEHTFNLVKLLSSKTEMAPDLR